MDLAPNPALLDDPAHDPDQAVRLDVCLGHEGEDEMQAAEHLELLGGSASGGSAAGSYSATADVTLSIPSPSVLPSHSVHSTSANPIPPILSPSTPPVKLSGTPEDPTGRQALSSETERAAEDAREQRRRLEKIKIELAKKKDGAQEPVGVLTKDQRTALEVEPSASREGTQRQLSPDYNEDPPDEESSVGGGGQTSASLLRQMQQLLADAKEYYEGRAN